MEINDKDKRETLVQEVLALSNYRDLVVDDEQLWWKDFKALLKFIKRNRINLFCPSKIEYFVLNVFVAGNKVECTRYNEWIIEQKESHFDERLTEDQVSALESIPGWIWFSENLESLQKNLEDVYYRHHLSNPHYHHEFERMNHDVAIAGNSYEARLKKIKDEFKRLEEECECSEVYCSSCGGILAYIKKNIEYKHVIAIRTLVELVHPSIIQKEFGHFSQILFQINRDAYGEAILDDANYLLSLAKEGEFTFHHERFLLINRETKNSDYRIVKTPWKKLYSLGLRKLERILRKKRIRSYEDISHLQTMLILLGPIKAKRYPRLISFGMEQFKKDTLGWQRLMYNLFRDTNKEVRSYKGLNAWGLSGKYDSKKGISGWVISRRIIYDYRTEIESEKLRQIPPRWPPK